MVVTLDKIPIGDCAIVDISDTGAQLKLGPKNEFPDEFYLVLAQGGKVRRRCKVVWRNKSQLGVVFRSGQDRQ